MAPRENVFSANWRLPEAISVMQRYGLLAILCLYWVAALASVVTLPVFEGADEQRHYAYARYLANNGALPPLYRESVDDPALYEIGQESGQPPLFYALVALVTAPIRGADDVTPFVSANPFMSTYDPTGLPYDNHNRYLRTQRDEDALAGVPLAVRLGRLVAVLLGTLTLVGVYGAGRAAAPAHPLLALLAVVLVATQPVFLFLSSIVSNDIAVICFSSLGTWAALRMVRDGPAARWTILGGLFGGMAVLSKFNGVWMIGLVCLAIILGAILRRLSVRQVLKWLSICAGVWLLVVGWWFVHGALANGDPFGLAIHALGDQAPSRISQYALQTLGQRLIDLELSTWYFSGWAGLVPAPGWLYTVLRVVWSVGTLGAVLAVVGFIRRREYVTLAQGGVLLVCIGLGFAGALYWALVYMWSLGRLMFPGLAAAAVICAGGWLWWLRCLPLLRSRMRLRVASVCCIVIALLVTATGGVANTASAYVRHPAISAIEPQMTRTELTFYAAENAQTKVASVVAYEFTRQDVRPDGALYGKVCWQAQNYTQRSYPYSLQLVGENDTRPGTRNSYHGLGSYPLMIWKRGEVFCDPVSIHVNGEVPRPRAYEVLISLFDLKSGPLTAVDAAGQQTRPTMTRMRLAPATMPVVTPTVNVGDLAGLVDWHTELRAGNTLSVTLRWVALHPDGRNAKVFLHVLDADGKMIAQHDHEPDGGWFPTAYWLPGDVVDDTFEVQLPAGTELDKVQLRAGLYDAETLARLPATRIVENVHLQDDLIPLVR